MIDDGRVRCEWGAITTDPEYRAYHDEEWGVPVRDERRLFELLILEGAQAGLSWSTILHKRERLPARLRRASTRPSSRAIGERRSPGSSATRDRAQPARRSASAIGNAQADLALQEGGGTAFVDHLWSFVGGSPLVDAGGRASGRSRPRRTSRAR